MLQALYSGAAAMKSQQRNIDTISNNVSNIDTEGFKKVRVDFKEAIYQKMQSPTENGPEINLQLGHGSLVYQTKRIFFQGNITPTDSTGDIAIEGNGFFTVGDLDGRVFYTRNGNFHVSQEPDGNYLVNPNGYYLLSEDGERISVEGSIEDMTIDRSGLITFTDSEAPEQKITLVTFTNIGGLVATGSNNYVISENSGEPIPEATGEIIQKALEASNVDMGDEMTRLVRAQRAYQLASRAISVTDQMAQTANAIRQ